MVPFFHTINPTGINEFMEANPGRQIVFNHKNGHKILINPQIYTKVLFKYLDGQRSFNEIFDAIREDLSNPSLTNDRLMQDFKSMFDVFVKLDWMLVRHKSVSIMPGLEELQSRMQRLTAKAA
jgi:hypothetical protein